MECSTQQWKLDKYARCVGKVQTKPRGKSNSEGNLKWKLFECGLDSLVLTVTDSHHLLITYNNEIQESHSLWDASTWMKGVSKNDSLLIIYKLQDETRQFRVKFSPENNKSAQEQCQNCIKRLSKYFIFKDLGAKPPVIKKNMNAAAEERESTNEVTIAKLAQIAVGKLPNQLPKAYHTTKMPTDPVFLQDMVQLCLSDTNFPAFVGAVETALNNIISEGETSVNSSMS